MLIENVRWVLCDGIVHFQAVNSRTIQSYPQLLQVIEKIRWYAIITVQIKYPGKGTNLED